ncbi:hypothetical protein DSO57_1035353 [Entomophthora muscae]|nr:hypothetical protein DSO57_1035353 [Entomophthora muscae]
MFQNGNLDFLSDMAIGAIAGAIAGGITTPLDVVKTVLQTQQDPTSSPRRSRPRPAPGTSGSLGLPKVPTPLTLRGSLLSMSRLPPGGPERAPYATGIIDGLQQSYRTYGIQGLFRGLAPRVAWTGFQSAILFLVYEQTIELLSR